LLIGFAAAATAAFGTGCFATDPIGAQAGVFDDAAASGKCLTPEDEERLADQVLQLVNLERAAADLPPVIRNSALSKMASDYACRMVEEGFFEHTDPMNGFGPGDRAIAADYYFYAIGENLAAGQSTPAEVMKVWMDSPSHRAIILDSKWSEIGVGVRTGGQYAIYWVQEFGAPADEE
jgi:uncharacterized protein YkwD